jgi:pyridoxal phosphate enzyme (YggS family)
MNSDAPAPADRIRHNLHLVRQRIAATAAASGRDPGSIRLIAVSKFVPAATLRHALAAGQRSFGENYLQEALGKQAQLPDGRIEWHYIGHLQTNKARQAAGKFAWLHTLDNLRLAERLATAMSTSGQTLNTLLQVNVAGDPDKHGLPVGDVLRFAETLLRAERPGIRLHGLMTIGRQQAGPDARRAEFAALRELSESCGRALGQRYFCELSMGMSEDYTLAIAEGATMLRIGSAIFGARPPANRR